MDNEDSMSHFYFDKFDVNISKKEIFEIFEGENVSVNVVNAFVAIMKYYNAMLMKKDQKTEKDWFIFHPTELTNIFPTENDDFKDTILSKYHKSEKEFESSTENDFEFKKLCETWF